MSSTFNYDLYSQIREERQNAGLEVAELTVDIPDHAFMGVQMHNANNDEMYRVVKVTKLWDQGWYLVALLEKDRDNLVCYLKSINCQSKSVLLTIEKHREIFEVL